MAENLHATHLVVCIAVVIMAKQDLPHAARLFCCGFCYRLQLRFMSCVVGSSIPNAERISSGVVAGMLNPRWLGYYTLNISY